MRLELVKTIKDERAFQIGVVYLARCADGLASFKRFVESYRSNPAGYEHDLVVIYKGFSERQTLNDAQEIFRALPHIGIEVDDRYYDIGSYLIASRRLPHSHLMFLNTHAELTAPNWLGHAATHMLRDGVGIVGATGSYESLHDSFALIQRVIWLCSGSRIPYDADVHKYYNFIMDLDAHCGRWTTQGHHQEANGTGRMAALLGAQCGLRWWMLTRPDMVFEHYDRFPRFPNPHIRSNAFLVDRESLLQFDPTRIEEKLHACMFECGEESLTASLRRRGLAAIVVGADGGGWDVMDWPRSRAFRLGDQSNLIVNDNQTRAYEKMSSETRLTHQRMTWGDYLGEAPKGFPTLGATFPRRSLDPARPGKRGPIARGLERAVVSGILSGLNEQRRAVARKPNRIMAPERPRDMKISVLIPSKDRLDLLKLAVASVLDLTDESMEIVISDNASRDDYRGYVDSLNDQRIIYSRSPTPLTVTDNWRRALKMSSGEYILMLGDDDALAPNFSSAVREYVTSSEGPDLLYLAAYHYGYPGVLPFSPSGYLASVKNSEFLLESNGPSSISREYALDLARSVLDFRYRFGFNAQHFLIKRSLVERCERYGGLYQSPYPDTFAGVAVLAGAESICVLSEPTVIIGISPRSFGAYYFSGRHDEGYAFLCNEEIDAQIRSELEDVILPGDRNNTNWLVAAEVARRRVKPALSTPLNVHRYRSLQILSTLRAHHEQQADSDIQLTELKKRLYPAEREMFCMIESSLAGAPDAATKAKMFDLMSKKLDQFTPADITYIDIGRHANIHDAVMWLRMQTTQMSLAGPVTARALSA